ncbi:heterokaryon incompatibility protein-domain-containing protein, partial [Xylariales sp. PMI_506]
MRLISTKTGRLVSHVNPVRGSYAILSHTWGHEDEEVSFEDYLTPGLARKKVGFAKIKSFCELAQRRNIDYAWVDTCCIDKSSSAELSEAINSMFKWYRDSAFCAVYLPDLATSKPFGEAFSLCRWLTRGWTLQELIAPRHVEFYDKDWGAHGDKTSRKSVLAELTGIDPKILLDSEGLNRVPIARRMSWAAQRRTTRVEDEAYSLLGIFGVNMPMIYGEGSKAFLRLQEEIAKDSGDLSLFCWTAPQPNSKKEPKQNHRGIFAASPSEFSGSRNIKYRTRDVCIEKEFAVTNRGL